MVGSSPFLKIVWSAPLPSLKITVMAGFAREISPRIETRNALMGNSGIPWVDAIFDWAVFLLADTARLLGMSYEEVNIWIFLVAWPLITIGMAIWIVALKMKYRKHLRTVTLR